MIPVFGCETARDLLDAFIDGELTTPQQVAMQSHIRSCRTCSAHVEDIALISWSMKTGPPRLHALDESAGAFAGLESGVIERVRAERAQSLRTRLSEMFSDMRLVWPALGASAAVVLCVIGSWNVWRLTTEKHPHSLAAMLERYENRGSDKNPLRLDDAAWAPIILNEGLALDGLPGGESDGDLLFEALFTRGGYVTEARLLNGSPDAAPASGTMTARNDGDDVLKLMQRWRLTPAQSRDGRPVSVRALILFSQTTVTGLGGAPFERGRRIERPRPIGARSAVERRSTAA